MKYSLEKVDTWNNLCFLHVRNELESRECFPKYRFYLTENYKISSFIRLQLISSWDTLLWNSQKEKPFPRYLQNYFTRISECFNSFHIIMSSNSCSDFGYFKLRHFRLFFKLFMYLVAYWKYRTYPFIKFTKVDCLNSAIHTIKKLILFYDIFCLPLLLNLQ